MLSIIRYLKRRPRLWKSALVLGITLAVGLGFLPLWLDRQNPKFAQEMRREQPTMAPTTTPSPTPTLKIELLSLEKVVRESQKPETSSYLALPQDKIRQVMLGGDVMLGRDVGFQMTRVRDFGYPFALIGQQLKSADLTVVNLENPIVENCPLTQEGMIFCSTPVTVSTLLSAGIDVVNLANNHTLNYGRGGMQQTVKFLDIERIAYTGLGTPAVVDVRGMKFGVIGYTQLGDTGGLLAEATPEKLVQDVYTARSNGAEIVMATFHWGAEYMLYPAEQTRRLAFEAIDAGADVVFGHHPHWVQGMEFYKGKPIFYSLGNLVFDQMWSTDTREGLVVELNFYEKELAGILWRPIFMENVAQPKWSPTGYGSTIVQKLETASKVLEETQGKIRR